MNKEKFTRLRRVLLALSLAGFIAVSVFTFGDFARGRLTQPTHAMKQVAKENYTTNLYIVGDKTGADSYSGHLKYPMSSETPPLHSYNSYAKGDEVNVEVVATDGKVTVYDRTYLNDWNVDHHKTNRFPNTFQLALMGVLAILSLVFFFYKDPEDYTFKKTPHNAGSGDSIGEAGEGENPKEAEAEKEEASTPAESPKTP